MVDLDNFFEPQTPIVRCFESLKEELESIKIRNKGMSVFHFPSSDIDGDKYKKLAEIALGLRLLLIHHQSHVSFKDISYDQITCFIVHPEETWRVPAYLLTNKAFEGHIWSESAERLISTLLGYSEENISLWIKHKRNARFNWSGATVYLLMDKEQRNLISRLSMRCIDPQSMIAPITAIYSRDHQLLRHNAIDMVPMGMVIGRVSIKPRAVAILFEKELTAEQPLISISISAENVDLLNQSLDSNFQFLDVEGWR
jgi:hypothetical protein